MPLLRPEKNALSFLLACESCNVVVNKKVLAITIYAGLPTFESYSVSRFRSLFDLSILV